MHKLFLSCLRATELIEKKLHFKLTAKENLQLKAHKMMCDACSLYEKQSVLIEKGISYKNETGFSPEELEKLKLIISQKLSKIKK